MPTGNFETKEVLDENGNTTYNTTLNLVSYGIKDKEITKSYNETQTNEVFEYIKSNLTLDNGYTSFIESVEQHGLLLGTQQDNPFGYGSEVWEILPNN